MNALIPELDKKGLRSFGIVTATIVVLLFGFLLPWLLNKNLPQWPWFIAMPLFVVAAIAPALLSPVYKLWMKIGHVLGGVNTRIILGIVFYLVIFPIGLVLRLFGKELISKRWDSSAKSYRISKNPRKRDHVERIF